MKIHTKRFTSSKSTVARILNKRCAEERYREDQVKARNKIAPPANVPEMLEVRTVAHPHSQQSIGLGGCVPPGPGASKRGGGRIYTKSGLKEI